MTLQPLLDAAPAIQAHAFTAMAAFALGLVQLAAPKGTLPHRTLGYIWVTLMVVVCVTSFWIHDLRVWGPWSPIHLLAIFTLIALPSAILHARRHQVARAPQRHDHDVCGRAADRGALHLPAGPDHARGGVWKLI